jgi:hypothetical protein
LVSATGTLWLRSTGDIACEFTVSLFASPAMQPWLRTLSATCSWKFGGTPTGSSQGAQVSTWLLAIARNKGITAIRRHCDEHLEVNTLEIEDPADNPEVLISNTDRRKAIQSALSQLSAAQREVIDLVYYHEKSVGEVAKIIGVPASTVKTRMFYARRLMKAVIETADRNGLFGAVGTRKNGQNNSW